MPRRRKRRHALNPLGWIPPAVWPMIGKAIAGGLVVAGPAVAVKQGQDAGSKIQAANDNTGAALNAVALLIDEQDSLKARIAALELSLRAMRLQYAKLAAQSPAAMVGPAVPTDWVPAPPKKFGWFARHFGRG